MWKYRIEITGGGKKETLNLEGCKKIEKYTSDEITLKLYDRYLCVRGKSLCMPVMVDENLCISGYIKKIEISPMEEQ